MENARLTPQALAERWELETTTLTQWRWNGRGPKFLKIGRRVFYRLNDVLCFEEKHVKQHTAQASPP